jgi:competence protein ComEC
LILLVATFLLGDMLTQQLTTLRSMPWLVVLTLLCVVIVIWVHVVPAKGGIQHQVKIVGHGILALMLGMLYTTCYTQQITSWTVPHEQEGITQKVTGDIVSLPVQNNAQAQFHFHLLQQNTLIKLTWRESPKKLQVGDRWQLMVKLKRLQGLHNPGGFDYESWALQHGLRATGSVIPSEKNKKLTHHWYIHTIDQLRESIQQQLRQYLPPSTTAHWLIALALGERADIPQEQWLVLRHTGTNHLMAIGGLHIGMVAGFVYWIMSWCWRRVPALMFKMPAQEAGACAALIAGWVYGALSGFALPAQRACLMLLVYVIAKLSRRKLNPWHVWAAALFVVLIANPLSVLSESFWLSFGTIALIIFGMSGRLSAHNLWWRWGRVQWVIGFGLLPLSLLLFQECSLSSFIANSIAIPWLGCLILPFCLLGTLFIFTVPTLGSLLLTVADSSLAYLWQLLEWLSHWQMATWSQAMPSALIFLLSLGGILLLITPAKFPARWLGMIWLAPLILFEPSLLRAGEAKVTLLDVGQGLSTVIQTRHHVLIFDAGPHTANVVVPFLRTQFVKQIDMMLISHGDEDHIGGASEVLQSLNVKKILTSVPEKFSTPAELCLAGQQWQWDGVNFSIIYPYTDTLHLGNDSSCVLRVDAGQDSVLIPGDIEKFAEQVLLSRTPAALHVSRLIAPHHGSHTSALPEFVAAVYPRYVLYATGYRNRYHFPHQDVVQQYQQIHAEAFDTAKNGAIQWMMGADRPITH